ncbi:SpoIID/LytB domain-containing protein, partial [Ilumatobacter nonamiensis]|uniref:SpoIID/LytB domain-containing protein n=1 Tax=Ilumatobacter nonamiensis TaxID=467093 RepID=UPI00058BFCC8
MQWESNGGRPGGPKSRPGLAALVVVLSAVLVLAPVALDNAPVAEGASDPVIALVIEGTGYGHGRGMSQWGAFGYAVDHGWGWQRILDHYYGGTISSTTSASQRITVRLTAFDRMGTVGVISYGNGVRWNGETAPAMRAQELSPGVFAVYRADRVACPSDTANWTRIGTHHQAVGSPLRFTKSGGDARATPSGNALGVCGSSGSVNHYRGAIEIVHTSAGNRVVNDVTPNNYTRGVVPREIYASWADAGGGAGANAVRAQAVAARSYGLAQYRSYTYDGSSTRYAKTCDTTACQVYGGSATRSSASGPATSVEQVGTDAAVLATSNVVRRWPSGSPLAGQFVSTEFSSSNGPRTAGGQFPPVNDIGDDTAGNPNHRWTRIVDADTFAAQNGLGTITGASMRTTNNGQYQGYDGIWFDDLVVTGTSGTYRKQAWDVKGQLGLPSPGFTVRVIRENTTSTSVGFIGDSVGYGVTASNGEFSRVTDGTFSPQTLDSVRSRCTTRTSCPGTSGVEAARALPKNLDLVVVELGYNDDPAHFASDIDAMMRALDARGVRQVAWVNLADIRRSNGKLVYSASNRALADAARRWGSLTVLDWNRASNTSERSRWIASDGVHLTTTGEAEFSLWLRERMLAVRAGFARFMSPNSRGAGDIIADYRFRPDWSSIASLDLDGDGTDEIMYYDASSGFTRVMDPNARGSGRLLGQYWFRRGWTSIAGADLDGDGADEIMYYDANSGFTRVMDPNHRGTGRLLGEYWFRRG